jgi:aspartate-semialdehyde dehydrogenase
VIADSRKILGLPDLRITATCARVPVLNCHGEALNVETRADLSPGSAVSCSRRPRGVGSRTSRPRGRYALASEVSGRGEVLVRRIWRDDSNPPADLNMWMVLNVR